MSEIEVETARGVMIVRMNRPDKKNAINTAMYRSMAEALTVANSDGSVRAVCIFGGPGAFCAGNDIGDFLAIAEGRQPPSEVHAFLRALATSTKPLVAGVDGLAVGIGTTMLMHCDLAYASRASVFRTPFLDLGLTPEAASSLIGPKLMGDQRAFALLALGDSFDAEAAREAGLVYAVLENGVEEAALDAARRLAAKPEQALAAARWLLRGSPAAVLERIDLEIDYFTERLVSKEAREAFKAFMGRKPE